MGFGLWFAAWIIGKFLEAGSHFDNTSTERVIIFHPILKPRAAVSMALEYLIQFVVRARNPQNSSTSLLKQHAFELMLAFIRLCHH